jgi:hypothetical protein
MSVFITANSTYSGKHSSDMIFCPLFAGEDVRQYGFRVMLTKERKVTLTMWDALQKRLRAYSSGFAGGASSKRISKELFLKEFKVESSYDKHTYFDSVYDLITNGSGVTQNDISGTEVHRGEVMLFNETLKHDVFMNAFLADTAKGTFDGTNYSWVTTDATFNATTGAITAGGKDVRYNEINGIWKEIFDNVANEPDVDGNKINRVTVANGAEAQVTTVDYTGLTAGTVGLDVNGRTFNVPFNTSIAQTLADFVSTHNATMQALTPGITVSDSASPLLTFTSDTPGAPMLFVNVTGTGAAGTIADTTANVLASTSLATDEAMTAMKNAINTSRKELKKAIREKKAVFLVTQSMWDNYEETLASSNPAALESMRSATQEGMTSLKYRGVPLVVTDIDGLLEDDTANEYPHRAILTIPDNIVLVLNGSIGETRMWFNPDENENRQRSQFEMNVDFIEPRLITAVY